MMITTRGLLLMVLLFLLTGNSGPELKGFGLASEALAASPSEEALLRELNALVGSQDAVILTDPQGRVLVARHPDQLLTPASVLKILTALAAIRVLGPAYRFETEVYQTGTGDLIVKGYGDPMLVSEVLAAMADTLREHLASVNNLILDDSFFDLAHPLPGFIFGPEPYYAPAGALSANFNTIHVAVDAQGNVISAEPQTPLLPYAIERLQGKVTRRTRMVFSHNPTENTLYAGHLLACFLEAAGVPVTGRIVRGKMNPEQDRLLYRFSSSLTLSEIIQSLMAFSNNFIANQLFFATAAAYYQPPATLEKAVQAHAAILADILNFEPAGVMLEGSGLARTNLLSARQVEQALVAFEPWYHLLRQNDTEYYKTGTLNTVRTRAGYLNVSENGSYRFVVLINTPDRTPDPVMGLLKRLVAAEGG